MIPSHRYGLSYLITAILIYGLGQILKEEESSIYIFNYEIDFFPMRISTLFALLFGFYSLIHFSLLKMGSPKRKKLATIHFMLSTILILADLILSFAAYHVSDMYASLECRFIEKIVQNLFVFVQLLFILNVFRSFISIPDEEKN